MEELVVTVTSLPLRIGVNTDRRGSALCRTVCICTFDQQRSMKIDCATNLWDTSGCYQTGILSASISLEMRGELALESLRRLY